MDRTDWTSRDFKAFQQRCFLFARLSGTLPLSVDVRQFRGLPNDLEDDEPGNATEDKPMFGETGFTSALTWVWDVWDRDNRPITNLSLTMYHLSNDCYRIGGALRFGRTHLDDYTERVRAAGSISLQSLDITEDTDQVIAGFDPPNIPYFGSPLVQLLRSFPNLRHFSYDAQGLADMVYIYPRLREQEIYCWDSVTSLHLTLYLTAADLWVLLTHCPNVEYATLSVLAFYYEGGYMPPAIRVHSTLKSLKLNLLLGENEIDEYFSLTKLRFPNLRKLVVEMDTGVPGMDLDDLVEYILPDAYTDVFPVVETLEITKVVTNRGQNLLNDYDFILKAIPTTRYISVHLTGIQQLQETLEFFNEFMTDPDKRPGQVEQLVLEVSPDAKFASMNDQTRDDAASAILKALGSKLNTRDADKCPQLDGDNNEDENDNNNSDNKDNNEDKDNNLDGSDDNDGDEDEDNDPDSNRHLYHTIVRYKCAKNPQDADRAERAYFMDLAGKFISDSLTKIVVEL